jgi:hypothetical protein
VVGVARVEAVALRQHHPSPRVETRVEDAAAAGAGGARSPVGADGAEPDVVRQVAGKYPARDEFHQIRVQRRLVREHLAVAARQAAELAARTHVRTGFGERRNLPFPLQSTTADRYDQIN